MAFRRCTLAEFRLLSVEGDDPGRTDTCVLEDDKIRQVYPKEDKNALTGRDFQWAEAAIEPSRERRGFFYIRRWGAKYPDGSGFVDVWSHGRLLVSVRRLDHGDEKIAYVTKDSLPQSRLGFLVGPNLAKFDVDEPVLPRIGTTDVKDILAAINGKERFRGKENIIKMLPFFSGFMTFLGPKECDVDLEWMVWLDEVCNHSITSTCKGNADEIIVQQ